MLALDWARAFDSIDPDALVVMLSRFGLLDPVLGLPMAAASCQNDINELEYHKAAC